MGAFWLSAPCRSRTKFQYSMKSPMGLRCIPDCDRPLNIPRDLQSNAQDRDRTIADSTEKSSDSAKGAAKCAAIDPMLAELLAGWDNLPPVIKSAILAVARLHEAAE